MMGNVLGILAGILALVQFAPYIRDILRRTTRPERATWAIWTTLSGLIFASQVAKGAGASLWMSAAQGLGNLTVLVLALRFGVGGYTRRDIAALILAGIGLVIWGVTKEPHDGAVHLDCRRCHWRVVDDHQGVPRSRQRDHVDVGAVGPVWAVRGSCGRQGQRPFARVPRVRERR
jgi:hypothetical protein